MKKLLSVLATIGIVASSAVSVVACGTKNEKKPEPPKTDISQIVRNFEQDVIKIWSEHYEKEVASNLITLEDVKNDYKFLNKKNIQYYSKPENKDKLTIEDKKDFTNDVEKLFKVKTLEEKLNELKKLNKYKIILDDVNSVFEHVELVFNDDFKINSGEIVEGTYIGNVIVDYRIVTRYKGFVDVEKFKQSGTLKYTSTDSESFKKNVGDAMYKNIAKDMFTSKETQKYVNLKWNDIKRTSDNSDAYLSSSAQLKKYYNENNEFHEVLLKTINHKYFKQYFPSIETIYNKESIYKTDDFAEQNKDYLIINNLYKSDEDIVTLDLANLEQKSKSSKILLADKYAWNDFLVKDQFSALNWSRIRNNYKFVQDTFLNTFLTKNEISEYKKTNYYNLAIAMGYIEFVGPVIKIGMGQLIYDHQLPDFKLAISYSMNGENDKNYKSIVDFSLKLLEVYKEVYQPFVSSETFVEYYLGVAFLNKNIWEPLLTPNKQVSKQNEFDFYLQNFNSTYFENIISNLSKIKISDKVLLDNRIVFNIFLNKNKSNNQSFFTNNKQGYFWINNMNSNYNFNYFEYYEYMILNLFGIIKIKMNFNDKTYKVDKPMVLF